MAGVGPLASIPAGSALPRPTALAALHLQTHQPEGELANHGPVGGVAMRSSWSLEGLSQIGRAETRFDQLLLWLGEGFGRVNSRGVSLTVETINLTHHHLAQISGLTRVTVTKSLSTVRQEGPLTKQGNDELLIQR